MKLDILNIRYAVTNAVPPEPVSVTYKPTSVFLLLFDKEEKTHILAIQKSDTEGYPWRNQVALPGGHVDKSDSSAAYAAFRELEEEVGIPGDQVEFIGSLGHFPTLNQRDIEAFIGLWNGKGPVRHDPGEIARVLEVPFEKLVRTHEAKNFHGRVPDIYDLTYPVQDAVIWGATARILHRFIELLYPVFINKYPPALTPEGVQSKAL
ncbi:CoA pyrophosphatase [Desulfococcaceae bacterium HSG8]|nr:CoA pyrophosphatase [Desulfococcaceae bacterium HSG8]